VFVLRQSFLIQIAFFLLFSLATICSDLLAKQSVTAHGQDTKKVEPKPITIDEVKKAINDLIEDKDFLKDRPGVAPLKERLQKMNKDKPITKEDVRFEEHIVVIGFWIFDPKTLTAGVALGFPDNVIYGVECQLAYDPHAGWKAVVTRGTMSHIKPGPSKR